MSHEPHHIEITKTEGSEDKFYRLHLIPVGDQWKTTYQNGRRGTAGTAPKDVCAPTTYEAAKAAYDQKLKSKLKDRYVPAGGGDALATQDIALKERSPHRGQHPTAIPFGADRAKRIKELASRPGMIVQEKKDGQRLMIEKKGDVIRGINKKCEWVPLLKTLEAFAQSWPVASVLLDGEIMKTGRYAAYELLEVDGRDMKPVPYANRLLRLHELQSKTANPLWEPVPTADTPESIAKLIDMLKRRHAAGLKAEGIVVKDGSATFSEGKASITNATQWKLKFTEASSFFVLKVNAQRSVEIGILRANGSERSCRNVTIPANMAVPAVGDILEVEYRHAFVEGGLQEPLPIRVRLDQDRSDCTEDQLKFALEGDLDETEDEDVATDTPRG